MMGRPGINLETPKVEHISNSETTRGKFKVEDFNLDGATFVLNEDGQTLTMFLPEDVLEELKGDMEKSQKRMTEKSSAIEKCKKYEAEILELFESSGGEVISTSEVIKKINASNIDYDEMLVFLSDVADRGLIQSHFEDSTDVGLFVKK